MEPSNWTDIIKELGALIVVVGGVVGAIYAGVTTLIRTRAEAKALVMQQEIENRKTKTADYVNAVELTERLNEISSTLLAGMEKRFSALQLEFEQVKERYRESLTRETVMRDAGLKLIEAIEEGYRARQISPKDERCAACTVQDRIILEKLKEVKEIFIQGTK